MILRIEDTDQTRFVEGAEGYFVEALKWCGIHFDARHLARETTRNRRRFCRKHAETIEARYPEGLA